MFVINHLSMRNLVSQVTNLIVLYILALMRESRRNFSCPWQLCCLMRIGRSLEYYIHVNGISLVSFLFPLMPFNLQLCTFLLLEYHCCNYYEQTHFVEVYK
jgi:hypothetical protein